MIRSMTGFGAASTELNGTHWALELRSLNNRYFKAQVRLPDELQGLEPVLDAMLTKRITRGSVIVTVRFSEIDAPAVRINAVAAGQYLDQLLALGKDRNDHLHVDLGALLGLPGVVVTGTGEDLVERAREALTALLDEACTKLIAMRDHEGEALRQELHKHCAIIADHLGVVVTRAPSLIEQYQQRLRQRMENLLAESGAAVREEDVLREVAVFAERSDIAEEIARLQGHLVQFRQIIDSGDLEPAGRTLDFIAQEMLREANTIGSKCLDVEVSKRIVEVKGAIDRIKEQVQNVE